MTAGKENPLTLDLLMNFVVNNTIRKIFLARDFNATTRNLNHDILAESEDMNKGNSSELSDFLRMSKDTTLNTRGRLFLDFLSSTNITLLKYFMLG